MCVSQYFQEAIKLTMRYNKFTQYTVITRTYYLHVPMKKKQTTIILIYQRITTNMGDANNDKSKSLIACQSCHDKHSSYKYINFQPFGSKPALG